MRLVRATLLVAAPGCGVVQLCAAQAASDPPAYLLSMPATVRGFALGDAGVALVGDAGAVFANPSGIATLSHIGLEGSYRAAPGDAYVATGAMGWRLGQLDLGFAGRYFDFGPDPSRYFATPVVPGTRTREALGVASVVFRYGMVAVGMSGKYARRSFADQHERGLSADAGLAIAVFDIMALAFSVQNLGSNWREASRLEMPRLTRVGFTMNYVDPQESFRLLTTVEVQWREGASSRAVIGGEGGVVLKGVGVVGRLAYGGATANLTDGGVTMGGSLQFGALKLDYAYRRRDLFDEPAHLIGARFTL
jgi:hypothetical protein